MQEFDIRKKSSLWQLSNIYQPWTCTYITDKKQVLHFCPCSSPPISFPHLSCLPSYDKQNKLNYRKPKTETAFFTDAERGKKTHHIKRLPPNLPSRSQCLFFSFVLIAVPNEGPLIRLSCGVESRQHSSPALSLSLKKWFIFLLRRWACEMSYIINSIGL